VKTLIALIQLAALSACFAAYVSATGDVHLAGMRRAMQTVAREASPIAIPAPAISSPEA
jgi:hypothetical protein